MTTRLIKSALGLVLIMGTFRGAESQELYTYPLNSSFIGQPAAAPDLIQVPNNSNLYGNFTERNVPASTCGQTGIARGYYFEDDAGLQFNNPAGFINQSYSIAFNFQIDEFITPPSWVRILSFTHTDDVGIYIKLTSAPTHGTLEFWPYGTVGTVDFFTTTDFYQMILIRDDIGHIQIYVNGNKFADYDDSNTQKYVPQSPGNFILWFRDHPSVLANEASPGFISDVRIGNYAWSASKVQEIWQQFCSSLLDVGELGRNNVRIFPNPADDILLVELPEGQVDYSISLFNITGQFVAGKSGCNGKTSLDLKKQPAGVYFLQIGMRNSLETYRVVRR